MTCGCAEKPQTSPQRAQTVPVAVRKTNRPPQRAQTVPVDAGKSHRHHLTGHKLYLWMCGKPTDITTQSTNCTCGCAENLQTSHRTQTVPVAVQKTYRHHHKGHKLYLWMCGKPTDITTKGTNCTCGCAKNSDITTQGRNGNSQASPHWA